MKSGLMCADCIKLIEYLPESFIVITDPPFGLKTDPPMLEIISRLREFVSRAEVSVVFSDWRSSHLFAQVGNKIGELIWEYGWVSGGRCKVKNGIFPCHNTLHIFGDKNKVKFVDGSIIKRQAGFSSPRQCSYANKTGHPYEKPVPLMEWLIDRIQCFCIVDPFMGVGSTMIAAKKRGKDYWGAEIEEQWFKIAQKRINKIPRNKSKLYG